MCVNGACERREAITGTTFGQVPELHRIFPLAWDIRILIVGFSYRSNYRMNFILPRLVARGVRLHLFGFA